MWGVSKLAVTAITESDRVELRALNSHIRMSQVSPGRVETEFGGKYLQDERKRQTRYAEYKALEGDQIASVVSFILSQPEDVQIADVFIRPVYQV